MDQSPAGNWATRSSCGLRVHGSGRLKRGPQVVKVLNDLAQNIEPFSKEDRRKLLDGLAIELLRQQDLQGASRLWSQLAEQDPNDLELRLTLLDLAFQIENKDEVAKKNEIEKNIKEIERIEGSEGLQGRFAQVSFLIWQAGQGSDKNKQEELRTSARVLLNELISRRADWSVIPLAQAQLEEQELEARRPERRREKGKRGEHRQLLTFRPSSSVSAIQPSCAVRCSFSSRTVADSEARELLNSIPAESQLFGDLYLRRQAEQFAVDNRDFQRAEEIVARRWPPTLVISRSGSGWSILLNSGHQADAETELRQAVDLSKSDPERWITLVGFMVFTKQRRKPNRPSGTPRQTCLSRRHRWPWPSAASWWDGPTRRGTPTTR